jgi:hypothetical protein
MSPRRSCVAILLTAVCGGCLLPSDHSPRLAIEVDSLPTRLLPGDTVLVRARLLSAPGTPIPNADFVFSSSDSDVVAFLARDARSALLRMRRAGDATLQVTAEAYPAVPAAERLVAVRPSLQIDSVRPLAARYGDTVTVYGVGLDPAGHPAVRGGERTLAVHHFTPVDPSRPWRVGRLAAYVTAGMPLRGPIAVRSDRGAATSRDTLVVTPEDIYEPNTDAVPTDLGTLTADLVNPALAFERRVPGVGTSPPVDAYRFATADQGAWTVRVAGLSGSEQQAEVNHPLGTNQWLEFSGGSSYVSYCRGTTYRSLQYLMSPHVFFPTDTLVYALQNTRAVIDLLLTYGRKWDAGGGHSSGQGYPRDDPYFLSIRKGYVSDLDPGANEPNDVCRDATPVSLSGAVLSRSLDRPTDFDWYRFEVTGPGAMVFVDVQSTVQIRPDILIGLEALPDSVLSLKCMCDSASATREADSIPLPAGRYLAVVYSGSRPARSGTYHISFSARPLPTPPALPEPVGRPHPEPGAVDRVRPPGVSSERRP